MMAEVVEKIKVENEKKAERELLEWAESQRKEREAE
jgi:hypothetical protein